jgi:hypothetical protein
MELRLRNHDKDIGIAAGDVLALPAMTLHGGARLSLKVVANFTAITSTFYFHLSGSSAMHYFVYGRILNAPVATSLKRHMAGDTV